MGQVRLSLLLDSALYSETRIRNLIDLEPRPPPLVLRQAQKGARPETAPGDILPSEHNVAEQARETSAHAALASS